MPDFLPAMETIAKGLRAGAQHAADTLGAIGAAFAEQRKAFDDDEAGDYLRCAGSDGLAEALCRAEEEQEVHEPSAFFPDEELTVCYFCDRPTDRTGFPAVCNVCAEVATTSPAAAIPPLATAADPAAAEPFPPSMTAAGPSNPFDDCGLFTAGAPFAADLDETISTVAELDWPDVAAALRIIANFLDPK